MSGDLGGRGMWGGGRSLFTPFGLDTGVPSGKMKRPRLEKANIFSFITVFADDSILSVRSDIKLETRHEECRAQMSRL